MKLPNKKNKNSQKEFETENSSETIDRLFERIIQAERSKLYMQSPIGIVQDIIEITKEEIKQ